MVPGGSSLADIGTDHAYLPIYLLRQGIIKFAVAGEVHQGPYHMAQETIRQSGLDSKISLRLGDGLAVLAPSEVDVAVIAGMGGSTIAAILEDSPAVFGSLSRVIIQPMNAASLIRRWLVQQSWAIYDEQLVREDGRLYEIIAARPGVSDEFESVLYEIGPVLWCKKPLLLKAHIETLIARNKRILQEMASSEQAKAAAKYGDYERKIREMELKLSCL